MLSINDAMQMFLSHLPAYEDHLFRNISLKNDNSWKLLLRIISRKRKIEDKGWADTFQANP